MNGTEANDPAVHLPLRPVEYQVLVGLSRGPRHGYAILQQTEERDDGSAVPGLATLYRAIRRLERDGLVEPSPGVTGDDDERRRYLRLTATGREVLRAETRRLRSMVQAAEAALEGRSR